MTFAAPAMAAGRQSSHSFPVLERVASVLWCLAIVLFYTAGFFAKSSAVPARAGFADWAPVISQGCCAVFFVVQAWLMLIRPRPVARTGLAPWTLSMIGTYGVWLVALLPEGHPSRILALISAAITLLGSVLIIISITRLGRSFSIAPQARRLVTSGPYSIVRNPLYAAEEIAIFGVLLQFAWYAAVPFLIVHLAVQLRRVHYEETLLHAVFPEYEDYARRTARLIPGIW